MADIILDRGRFLTRIQTIYEAWNSQKYLALGDVDIIWSGLGSRKVVYSKSKSLQIWLFGYELYDTITVFCKNGIYILSSKEKIDFLRQLENIKENLNGLPLVHLLVRDKTDKDAENYKTLIRKIKESGQGRVFGEFSKDTCTGEFMEGWSKVLKSEDFKKDDLSSIFALLMAPKDEHEIACVKKACEVTCKLFNEHLREQIIDIVDSEKSVKHAKLSDGCEEALQSKKYLPAAVDVEQCDMCYPARIQSGGTSKLNFSMLRSDERPPHFGTIHCSLGTRYKSYCSNIVRTVLVDPSKELQDIYGLVLEVQEKVIGALRPVKSIQIAMFVLATLGVKMSEVYDEALQFVKSKRPDLLDKFRKCVGCGMGLECQEESMLLCPENTALIEKGMLFNVNLGFGYIENPDAKDEENKTVSFVVGDTVLVSENGPAVSLTEAAKKRVNDACLFKNEAEAEEEDNAAERLDDQQASTSSGSPRRNVILQDQLLIAENTVADHSSVVSKTSKPKLTPAPSKPKNSNNYTFNDLFGQAIEIDGKATKPLPSVSQVLGRIRPKESSANSAGSSSSSAKPVAAVHPSSMNTQRHDLVSDKPKPVHNAGTTKISSSNTKDSSAQNHVSNSATLGQSNAVSNSRIDAKRKSASNKTTTKPSVLPQGSTAMSLKTCAPVPEKLKTVAGLPEEDHSALEKGHKKRKKEKKEKLRSESKDNNRKRKRERSRSNETSDSTKHSSHKHRKLSGSDKSPLTIPDEPVTGDAHKVVPQQAKVPSRSDDSSSKSNGAASKIPIAANKAKQPAGKSAPAAKPANPLSKAATSNIIQKKPVGNKRKKSDSSSSSDRDSRKAMKVGNQNAQAVKSIATIAPTKQVALRKTKKDSSIDDSDSSGDQAGPVPSQKSLKAPVAVTSKPSAASVPINKLQSTAVVGRKAESRLDDEAAAQKPATVQVKKPVGSVPTAKVTSASVLATKKIAARDDSSSDSDVSSEGEGETAKPTNAFKSGKPAATAVKAGAAAARKSPLAASSKKAETISSVSGSGDSGKKRWENADAWSHC